MTINLSKEWLYGMTESVSTTGNRLYATFGDILRVYDITNVDSGTVNLLYEFKYFGVCVPGGSQSGKYLVSNSKMVAVAEVSEGVRILDVSDNSSVKLTYDAPSTGLAVSGDTLYIANYNKYIAVNVANPKSPAEITRVSVACDGIYTNGSVICAVSGNLLNIYNMSNSPIASKSFTATVGSTTYNELITDIGFYGNYILMCGRMSGRVYVLDSSGNIVSYYDNGKNTQPKIAVTGNYAVVAYHDYRVEILDLSNINSPTLAGTYDYASHIGGYPRDVRVNGNYFYLAASYEGVDIVNIASITSPYEKTKIQGFGRVYAGTISNDGRYIFQIDDMGMGTIDLSGPTEVNYLYYGARADSAIDMDRSKNLLFCPVSWGGLKIINASNPANPQMVLDFNQNAPGYPAAKGYIDSVKYYNGNIYCNVGTDMYVFQLTSSDTLNTLGSYPLGGRVQYVHDVANINGTNTAFASSDSNILLLNVNNPGSISQISSISANSWVNKLKVSGNTAYAAIRTGELMIIDVSNPTNPIIKSSSVPLPGIATALDVNGTTVYMGTSGAFMEIDASNPSSPNVITRDNIENGREILFAGYYNGNIVVAAEGEGVKLYTTGATSCTPNWQCEQPLDGYEFDGCGNRRQSTACNTSGGCIPSWQCEQPLDGYEFDNCGNRRINSSCNPTGITAGCTNCDTNLNYCVMSTCISKKYALYGGLGFVALAIIVALE